MSTLHENSKCIETREGSGSRASANQLLRLLNLFIDQSQNLKSSSLSTLNSLQEKTNKIRPLARGRGQSLG